MNTARRHSAIWTRDITYQVQPTKQHLAHLNAACSTIGRLYISVRRPSFPPNISGPRQTESRGSCRASPVNGQPQRTPVNNTVIQTYNHFLDPDPTVSEQRHLGRTLDKPDTTRLAIFPALCDGSYLSSMCGVNVMT